MLIHLHPRDFQQGSSRAHGPSNGAVPLLLLKAGDEESTVENLGNIQAHGFGAIRYSTPLWVGRPKISMKLKVFLGGCRAPVALLCLSLLGG